MRRHHFVLATLVAVLALLLAACTTSSSDDDVAEAADDTVAEAVDDASDDAVEADDEAVVDATDDEAVEADDEALEEAADDAVAEETDDSTNDALSDEEVDQVLETLGFQSADAVDVPELNVSTLEAEAPERVFQAEAYEHVYVGAVTEELFIGISLDSAYPDQAREISVYICDSIEIATFLTGHLSEDGEATLSGDGAEIELTVDGDEIRGVVTLDNGGDSFSATPATGDAGMYRAIDVDDAEEFWGRWIVLEDGRQRGMMCVGFAGFRVCVTRDGIETRIPLLN